MQRLSDGAVADLAEHAFRHPARSSAPWSAGSRRRAAGVGAYYTGPSDDLTRPGRMWWAVEPGREVFSTWRETTVVYHEGVPGHHLQIGTAVIPQGQPQRLPATAVRHLRLQRGLGAVRRTTGPRAGLPRRRRRAAGHARLAAVPRRPGDRRHRHAPGAGDPGRHRLPRGGAVDAASSAWSSCSPARSPTRRTAATRSTATWAGPGRRRPTRSASGSGWPAGTPPGAGTETQFDLKAFHIGRR